MCFWNFNLLEILPWLALIHNVPNHDTSIVKISVANIIQNKFRRMFLYL